MVCLVIAMSCHLLLYALVHALLPVTTPLPERKTTQTIILKTGPTAVEQQPAQASSAGGSSGAGRQFLSSTGDSINRTTEARQYAAEATTPPTRDHPQKSIDPKEQAIPEIRLPTNQLSQRQRPPSMQSLFTKPPTETEQNVEQISTQDLPELSGYEKLLLQRLSQQSLYDDFHAVMASHTRNRVIYIVSLRLFSTGAIRSAQITRSSGIPEIDRLALQTAYRASPFPAPPESDAAKEFRYQIPIIYDRNPSAAEHRKPTPN
jgi:TonB family protein